MFPHMDDIVPLPKYTFNSYLNVFQEYSMNIAANGSDLCAVFIKNTHCLDSNIVLSLKYDYISLEKVAYKTAAEVYYIVRKSNTKKLFPPMVSYLPAKFSDDSIL